MPKTKIAGKLFSRRHTTLGSKHAKVVCDLAVKFAEIKKISPGIIKIGLQTKTPRIKIMLMQGGVLIKIASHATAQDIRLYLNNPTPQFTQSLENTLRKNLKNTIVINGTKRVS